MPNPKEVCHKFYHKLIFVGKPYFFVTKLENFEVKRIETFNTYFKKNVIDSRPELKKNFVL